MTNESELRKLIEKTPPGETVIYPATKFSDHAEVRFFAVSSSYEYKPELFKWPGRPPIGAVPYAATFWTERVPLSEDINYQIEFHGPKSKSQHYFSSGGTMFLSDKLKNIVFEIDPGGLEVVECDLVCSDGSIKFWAAIPSRSIIAPDILGTDVEIKHKIGPVKNIPFVRLPLNYLLNEDIDQSVHIFHDAVSPKIYWSEHLLQACKSGGVRGLLAVASYHPRNPSFEM